LTKESVARRIGTHREILHYIPVENRDEEKMKMNPMKASKLKSLFSRSVLVLVSGVMCLQLVTASYGEEGTGSGSCELYGFLKGSGSGTLINPDCGDDLPCTATYSYFGDEYWATWCCIGSCSCYSDWHWDLFTGRLVINYGCISQ